LIGIDAANQSCGASADWGIRVGNHSEILVIFIGEAVVVIVEFELLDYFVGFETLQVFLFDV